MHPMRVLLVTTASLGLARSEANHLYRYDHVFDPYSRASRPGFDPIFVDSDSFRRPSGGHPTLVRSPTPTPAPITVSSPSPYHNYQQYPYFSHLTPTNRPLVPSPSSPSPSPSPSPYDYPLPPIPTYPPTPGPGYHRGLGQGLPNLPNRPLRPVRPPPSITFLDPDPLQPSSPSPSNIEVRPRSFTPRPHTPEPRPANDPEPEEENTGEETDNQAHLPALTLSEESVDDVTDDLDDYDGDDYDETIPPTEETEYEYSDDDEEIDPSEVFPELATEAPTLETVTEAFPDVTENEVETQATLIEVIDEIFEDPSLPREQHQDVPRSPQFFVPTPLPAVPSPNQPALTFETASGLDEDEHAFHNHFLSSVEGEASLVGKMFRDEQDIAEQEALHHHEEHEEGHHDVMENEIRTSVTPRPSEHKGRRVLKKRPIRIKIPAGLRQNLQVIPESLTQDVEIQDDDIIIATPTPTTVTPSLAFQEPAAFQQQQVFNPNLLNRPTTPPSRLEQEVELDFVQEPRQPKALTVFSADYDTDTPEKVIFGQEADNNVRQQEAVPQNFSPIFAVPSPSGVSEEEPRSAGLLQRQQNVNIDTSSPAVPAVPALTGFNAARTAANSPPPTFRPILRQPSDYIFTPQQFSAPAIQQQQQPQQFANGPFQQQTQQQFRPAEAPRQQFRPQSFQQQDQDFNFAPQQQQQQQAFTSFSPPVSQRQPQPPQAPALTFQEPTREQKAFPQQQAFNNNFLNRPTTPAPQQQQQFNTNFAPRPQEVVPPQSFTQSTPAPPPQQQFNNNFAPQTFTQSTPAPPPPPQQQQQFNNNFAPRPQEIAPQQTFSQSTPAPPQTFSSNNNFNSNFAASPSPAQNEEQSLFAMINRQAADRPVRTKLQQSDKSILRNSPKSSSSALENLLSIAGKDWDTNLHVSKTTSQASDFTCPAVEGHYPDPESCNIYHQCAGGVAHATTCQPGLAWNVVINMCDWEANVDCDINRGLKPIPVQEEGQQQQQSQQQQPQPFSQFAPAFTAFLF